MNIVTIIPARGGSKGIPKKNIIDFCGKPLLAWSIKQALESNSVNEVFVSSDDDIILEEAKNYGAKTIKRPAELATGTAKSEDTLLHALDTIGDFGGKPVIVGEIDITWEVSLTQVFLLTEIYQRTTL